MTGVMQGHFDTVLWVYGLTTAGLLGYFATLLLRLRASEAPKTVLNSELNSEKSS